MHHLWKHRYESTILPNGELEVVLDSTDADLDGSPDLYIGHWYTSIVVFLTLPIVATAALGGVYEALWKKREICSAGRSTSSNGSFNSSFVSCFASSDEIFVGTCEYIKCSKG